MKTTRRTAGLVAAWTTVAVVGAGSLAGAAMAADSGSPTPSPTASGTQAPVDKAGHDKGHSLRARTLHGEFVTQGKDGVVTVLLQKGSVTAISATSMTVKSTDGFTVTWTFNDKTKVRNNKTLAALGDVKTGAEIRVIGPKSTDGATARVIGLTPAA